MSPERVSSERKGKVILCRGAEDGKKKKKKKKKKKIVPVVNPKERY